MDRSHFGIPIDRENSRLAPINQLEVNILKNLGRLKKVAFLLIAIAVALTIVSLVTTETFLELGGDASTKDDLSVANQIQRDPGDTPSKVNLSRARENPLEGKSTIERNRKLLKISDAADEIIRKLEEDESKRARLISENETDTDYNYVFSIEPNANLDMLIAQLIESYSKDNSISTSGLKLALRDKLDDFSIPSQSIQQSHIQIPKSSDSKINYVSFNRPKGEESNVDISEIRGRINAASVDQNVSNWRYKHLLDLSPSHPPSDGEP